MTNHEIARRHVLKAAPAGLLILRPETVFGSQANSAVEIGIVGCGNRGGWMAQLFAEHTGSRVVALADLYRRQADALIKRAKIAVDPSRVYLGLDAGQRLFHSKLDAVVLETPTYAFPALAKAAVGAGRHVFMAKPVAVDVPGCMDVKAAGTAARGKLSFLVDFQVRAQAAFQEAAQRVRRGDIGTPVLGQVNYHSTSVRPKPTDGLTPAEARMRNWYFYRALAGGLLVSRDIHVIDGANFFLGCHPEKASGIGRLTTRKGVGDCDDNFVLTFWYPNGCLVDFSSTEFTTGYNDMCMRFYGTLGTVDAHYNGLISIGGSNPWPGVPKDDTFRGGAIANVKAFIESLRTGRLLNNADDAVESNLSTLLGMAAAHAGRTVTWEELLRSRERLDPEVSA